MVVKLNVVGVGRLGEIVAWTAALKLDCKQIRLIDIDLKKLVGVKFDLEQGCAGLGIKTEITLKPIDANITVLSLGHPREPHERVNTYKSRNKLLIINALHDLKLPPGSLVVLLTNPVSELHDWARKRFPDLDIWDVEGLLMEARGWDDNSQRILETKGFTSFGPASVTVDFIRTMVKPGGKWWRGGSNSYETDKEAM